MESIDIKGGFLPPGPFQRENAKERQTRPSVDVKSYQDHVREEIDLLKEGARRLSAKPRLPIEAYEFELTVHCTDDSKKIQYIDSERARIRALIEADIKAHSRKKRARFIRQPVLAKEKAVHDKERAMARITATHAPEKSPSPLLDDTGCPYPREPDAQSQACDTPSAASQMTFAPDRRNSAPEEFSFGDRGNGQD